MEVLEDGLPLGPQVRDARAVRDLGGGAFAVVMDGDAGPWNLGTVYFTATDDTAPRSNGRQYSISFPRRQLPASSALVLFSWALFTVAVVCSRPSLAPPLEVQLSAWSVFVAGALYSVFAVQAWLPAASAPWLVALTAVGFVPFLLAARSRRWILPVWVIWLSGMLAWALGGSLIGTSYASPTRAAGLLATSVGGGILYLGFRERLASDGRRPLALLVGLFYLVVFLSLLRDSGFDLVQTLTRAEIGSTAAGEAVNPWTTKFTSHWLLVVGWCALAFLGLKGRDHLRAIALVVGSMILVSSLNGSTSGAVALALSLAVAISALVWPRLVRRGAVVGLVLGILCAPLLAGLPWAVETHGWGHRLAASLNGLATDGRGGIWEFSRRLISLRPVVGWGVGASESLPGRDLTVAAVLGTDPVASGGRQGEAASRHLVLAGGHPHDAALLTWMDLGLVGALLLAGLVWAIGRSIAGLEEQRSTHAALLGLLTVNACFLAFNYPAWQPEVQSILWMSAALATSVLPRPTVGRRELLLSGASVLVLLVIGSTILGGRRIERWLTWQELRDDGAVLEPKEGALVLGGAPRKLVYGADVKAAVELLRPDAGPPAVLRGWAFGPTGSRGRSAVLVFTGPTLAGIAWPERPSPGLYFETRPRDVRALVSGFAIGVDAARLDLDAPVTVVILRGTRAFAKRLPPLSQGIEALTRLEAGCPGREASEPPASVKESRRVAIHRNQLAGASGRATRSKGYTPGAQQIDSREPD